MSWYKFLLFFRLLSSTVIANDPMALIPFIFSWPSEEEPTITKEEPTITEEQTIVEEEQTIVEEEQTTETENQESNTVSDENHSDENTNIEEIYSNKEEDVVEEHIIIKQPKKKRTGKLKKK